jgi:hypothetical protein
MNAQLSGVSQLLAARPISCVEWENSEPVPQGELARGGSTSVLSGEVWPPLSLRNVVGESLPLS